MNNRTWWRVFGRKKWLATTPHPNRSGCDVSAVRQEAFGPITDDTRAEDRKRIAEQWARDHGLGGLFR